MTTGQRVAIALGLVGAFLVSVAMGGFVARQLRGPSVPAVAVVSPTPSNRLSAPPSVAPAATASLSATSTAAATATPTPTLAATATVTPTPAASPEATPTETATAVPTPTPTPAATPTPTPATTATPAPSALDPPTVEEFVAALQAAINSGDNAYLAARLHPTVIDRYGAIRCLRHLKQIPADPTLTWEIQGSTGPASWTWTTDGLDTVIDDTWTVSVKQPGATPELRDLHFAPADGQWRWFTDCGSPK